MALTEAQIDSVFEIIEIPRATTVEQPVGNMGLTGQTFTESNEDFQLSVKVEARLAALSSTQQTRLITYIDKWDALGTQVYALDGGTGAIDGVSYSPADEMAEIKRRVKLLIGVYQMIDQVKKESKYESSTVIPVLN